MIETAVLFLGITVVTMICILHWWINVEGFVVNYSNKITKYVRMKNGKLQEHFDRGE